MSEVKIKEATDLLLIAINRAEPGDLAEYHNELFSQEPVTEQEATKDRERVLQRVTGEFQHGLEIDGVLGLGHIVYPQYRNISYDEETESIQYNEGKWPYYYAEELR